MASDDVGVLQDALRQRGIKTMRSAPVDPGYAAISMSTYSVQEFLNALAPGPIDGDDNLAMRIIGRPSDLGVEDKPWSFEAVPSVRDMESPIELHVIVSFPASDVGLILARLQR